MKTNIKTLKDLYNSEAYQIYEGETLLNIQYHIINTNKNIDEMLSANDNGNFGCSHSEFIESWKDYLNTLSVFDPEYDEEEDKNKFDIDKYTYESIMNEINECEQYHINANTIDQII